MILFDRIDRSPVLGSYLIQWLYVEWLKLQGSWSHASPDCRQFKLPACMTPCLQSQYSTFLLETGPSGRANHCILAKSCTKLSCIRSNTRRAASASARLASPLRVWMSLASPVAGLSAVCLRSFSDQKKRMLVRVQLAQPCPICRIVGARQ